MRIAHVTTVSYRRLNGAVKQRACATIHCHWVLQCCPTGKLNCIDFAVVGHVRGRLTNEYGARVP